MYKDYRKLQQSIGGIQKNATNPHFKNTYVELNTALDVINEKLEENNFICFIQTPITIDGKNYLNTKLIHISGEFIESNLELITTKQDPQMLGSSLTYARRYSLLTMLGLKAEDDDGNLASGNTDKKEKVTFEENNNPWITDEEVKHYIEVAKNKGSKADDVVKGLRAKFKISKKNAELIKEGLK